MTSLQGWLATRHPAVPDALNDWLSVDGDLPPSVDGLATAGVDSLDRARVARRLDRDAAFRLLVADAFLTYACEAAADEADVASCLDLILDHCAAAWR